MSGEGTVAIIIACIGALATIATTIISSISTNRKVQNQLETGQAVTNVKIDELKKEVEKHNNFVEEIPVLKYRQDQFEKELNSIKGKVES